MANLRERWQDLRTGRTTHGGSGYRLQLLETCSDVRLYAALVEPGLSPAVVAEIPATARPREPMHISSRAFEAIAGEFAGLPAGRVGIAVQLRDTSYEDLFALLCEDIVASVRRSNSAAEAVRSIVRCIERWRRFLERNRRTLSEEQVQGLIGELVVLARCVAGFGPRVAVSAWTGPRDALRDFELPDASVEVKTFRSDTGASVRVNDPQQLDDAPPRPVYLAAVQIARMESRGRTLPECVGSIVSLLSGEPDAAELFENLLAEYGYLPAHAHEYPQRFQVATLLLHAIREGFPRIKVKDVPMGVLDVHFSVAISSIAAFRVDPCSVLKSAIGVLEEVH